MQVPLLDLKAQYQSIKQEMDEAVRNVIESQYFILSPEVASLEEEIAAYCGVDYTVGVASGTDAIILSLRAAGIGRGDIVITTPFTFFATAESISILGATPAFVDIDPETYNIDPEKIEEYIQEADSEKRSKIKAVVPVHLYGQCADMTRIMDISQKYDLKVVEDCAQAIGAEHNGKIAGSFGTAGTLSFFPSKNLGGFGDGGMVISNDKDVMDKIKKLRVHGSSKQYIHDEIGYNSRLDSLQAALLRVKLRNLDKWIEGRQKIASKYNEALPSLGVTVPKIVEGNNHTYHQYTIAVDDRDGLLKYLNEEGVAARVYYPVPLHLQPCYKDLGYSTGSFPVSEKKTEDVLSLPVYPELSKEQVEHVIDTVKKFYKK
ncbi:MAG: DegT/DnrJ/EryC1/StrS family aminotransferase [Candidatus Tantalella remota]|nr:DegT/DnrJ/EryC1/StrS family aminotransferase [Candidatus Tantalella remota]